MSKAIVLLILLLGAYSAHAEFAKTEFAAQHPTREAATELSLFGLRNPLDFRIG